MRKISVKGGIVGGIIGAICAGPLGVAIGIGFGLFFIHFNRDEHRRRLEKDTGEDDEGFSELGLCFFFRCMGKLAKSDGVVSEDEVEFVRSIMRVWHMSPEARRDMAREFNKGRDDPRPFRYLIRELEDELRCCHTTHDARVSIMQAFCALVAVDREVHPAERRILMEAGRVMGVQETVEEFFADDDYTREEEQTQRTDSSLERAYELLGIPPTASEAEVKAAFRRKAREFHPDFAEGKGLSASAIQRTKTIFQEINNAYDIIRQQRGMK